MKRRKAEQTSKPAKPTGHTPVTRREVVLLVAIFAMGVLLRLIAFSHSAVEHFDEGVYASNIYFDAPDYAYPLQRFYAPPLLPALIETGMIVGLPPNVAALVPSFIAGCGTIIALWWFARCWFGPPVGIAAATLVALSDFHVIYSATALTDVLLGLWLVLAVDAIGRSLLKGDFRWAVGGGLYTGLAWWTKYNGWLPLAIEGATLPVLWLFLRPQRKQLMRWLACVAVTAVVAVAVWSPYYLSLQSSGGYGPIAANHAKYVVGFAGWFDGAARQMSNMWAMESLPGLLAMVAAMTLPSLLVRRENVDSFNHRLRATCFAAALWALFVTSAVVVVVAASVGICRLAFTIRERIQLDDAARQSTIGLSLVTAWWAGLLVATTCYNAYPRLMLPGLLAAWIGTSMIWADLGQVELPRLESWSTSDWKRLIRIGGIWLAYCAFVMLYLAYEGHLKIVTNRQELVAIAKAVRSTRIGHELRAIHVYGEPALYFQLRAAGEEIVSPVTRIPDAAATINGQAIPTFLAFGPHANRDPHFKEQWAAAEGRWELVHSYDYQPSAVVWLDLHDPRQPLPKDARENNAVRLYRLR